MEYKKSLKRQGREEIGVGGGEEECGEGMRRDVFTQEGNGKEEERCTVKKGQGRKCQMMRRSLTNIGMD